MEANLSAADTKARLFGGSKLFPLKEIECLLRDLPDGEPLDDAEQEGIARVQRLMVGTYPTRANALGL